MLVAISKALDAAFARPELLVGRYVVQGRNMRCNLKHGGFFGRLSISDLQATLCIRILLHRDLFMFMLV
jgi:hypothetical protein